MIVVGVHPGEKRTISILTDPVRIGQHLPLCTNIMLNSHVIMSLTTIRAPHSTHDTTTEMTERVLAGMSNMVPSLLWLVTLHKSAVREMMPFAIVNVAAKSRTIGLCVTSLRHMAEDDSLPG